MLTLFPAITSTPTPGHGPWAWTLDSALSTVGIGVAALGAVVTALLAWLALAQTKRANRLEVEAREREVRDRERAQRAEMRSAVSVYLDTWKPSGDLTPQQSREADIALAAAAAEISSAALDVAKWVTDALSQADFAAIKFQERHDDDVNPAADRSTLLREALTQAKIRVISWVATDQLDKSPLADYLYARDGVKPPATPTS